VPAGSNETAPPVKLNRAAREGGASESRSCATANFGKKKVAANSVAKRASHLVVLVLICISPEACECESGVIESRLARFVSLQISITNRRVSPGAFASFQNRMVPGHASVTL